VTLVNSPTLTVEIRAISSVSLLRFANPPRSIKTGKSGVDIMSTPLFCLAMAAHKWQFSKCATLSGQYHA